ncbi:MAG TPA: ankyrin repeat domain-containing protein [Terracidiphilus sp.]|nr:ankyrin repeat domain-containing protein [Terracidiphilus sp.]
MPDNSSPSPRALPDRPNLRHLKDEAKQLLREGHASSLAEAQLRVAQQYGFASWPRLKQHVDSAHETGMLKHAIDSNDFAAVRTLMMRNPELHRAPLGYGKNGPLTWVAECRIPWEPPGPARLAMAQWMIDNGSDVHQGGGGPLMRAALRDDRIPMMELLVRNGADVNAEWSGRFPILFAPCETLAPLALKWLLDHGADPQLPTNRGHESPLDYVIGTYSRSVLQAQCIKLLMDAGCPARRNVPPVLELMRGRLDRLGEMIDSDPALVHRRFPELDFGSTAYRRLTLRGATLLHVAAEYGNVKAAQMLLGRGADPNARADVDADGVGGQTPLFHAASQFFDYGLEVVKFLVGAGADLNLRVRLPGHYEAPDEFVDCTALGYARRFPGPDTASVAFLRTAGAAE